MTYFGYVIKVTLYLAALCSAVYILVSVAFWIDRIAPGTFWIPIVSIVLILLGAYLLWADEYDQGE